MFFVFLVFTPSRSLCHLPKMDRNNNDDINFHATAIWPGSDVIFDNSITSSTSVKLFPWGCFLLKRCFRAISVSLSLSLCPNQSKNILHFSKNPKMPHLFQKFYMFSRIQHFSKNPIFFRKFYIFPKKPSFPHKKCPLSPKNSPFSPKNTIFHKILTLRWKSIFFAWMFWFDLICVLPIQKITK